MQIVVSFLETLLFGVKPSESASAIVMSLIQEQGQLLIKEIIFVGCLLCISETVLDSGTHLCVPAADTIRPVVWLR